MWLVGKLIVLWWGGLDVKLCEGSHDGALGVVTVGDHGLLVGRQGMCGSASRTKYGANRWMLAVSARLQ